MSHEKPFLLKRADPYKGAIIPILNACKEIAKLQKAENIEGSRFVPLLSY